MTLSMYAPGLLTYNDKYSSRDKKNNSRAWIFLPAFNINLP